MNEDFNQESNQIKFNIGGIIIDCNISRFLLESNVIRSEMNSTIEIEINVSEEELLLIKKFLMNKELSINSIKEYNLFKKLNLSIQLPYLYKKLRLFKQNQHIYELRELNIIHELYQLVILFQKEMEETIKCSCQIIFLTGADLFVRTVLFAILAKPSRTDDYITLLNHLPEEIESFQRFIQIFMSEFLDILENYPFKNEVYYITYLLLKKGCITKEEICEKLRRISEGVPLLFINFSEDDPSEFQHEIKSNFFYENISSLSENEWELHKKLVEKGVNPNPIACAIREDDIDTFKLFFSNPYFDPNMILDQCIYERSTISSKNITLIEYAAFHNSMKCFNYLVENGADTKNDNIYKYLICGHFDQLDRQNVFYYKNFFRDAIYYHNDTAIYNILSKNDIYYDDQILEYAKLMIKVGEIEGLLYFLTTTPIQVDDLDDLINTAKENDNILLIQILKEIKKFR